MPTDQHGMNHELSQMLRARHEIECKRLRSRELRQVRSMFHLWGVAIQVAVFPQGYLQDLTTLPDF